MKTTSSSLDLQLYLRDIRDIDLLTVDEERLLGWRIINDGDHAARQILVQANLRLVVFMARKYLNRGQLLADLIEEGNVGLLRAAEDFDPAHGVRFASYAWWWIRQAMTRANDASTSIIRIPAHVREVMSKCASASRLIESIEGREPTLHELSDVTGRSLNSIAVANRARRLVMSMQRMAHEDSRNQPEWLDQIHDTSSCNADLIVEQADEVRQLRLLLETLDSRGAGVLRMRFGLDGRPRRSLREISREIGLTRERVRQIEMDCLARLRKMFSDPLREQDVNEMLRTPTVRAPVWAWAYSDSPRDVTKRTGPRALQPA